MGDLAEQVLRKARRGPPSLITVGQLDTETVLAGPVCGGWGSGPETAGTGRDHPFGGLRPERDASILTVPPSGTAPAPTPPAQRWPISAPRAPSPAGACQSGRRRGVRAPECANSRRPADHGVR